MNTLYDELQKHVDRPCLDCREALFNNLGTQMMCEEGFRLIKEIQRWERSQK